MNEKRCLGGSHRAGLVRVYFNERFHARESQEFIDGRIGPDDEKLFSRCAKSFDRAKKSAHSGAADVIESGAVDHQIAPVSRQCSADLASEVGVRRAVQTPAQNEEADGFLNFKTAIQEHRGFSTRSSTR